MLGPSLRMWKKLEYPPPPPGLPSSSKIITSAPQLPENKLPFSSDPQNPEDPSIMNSENSCTKKRKPLAPYFLVIKSNLPSGNRGHCNWFLADAHF